MPTPLHVTSVTYDADNNHLLVGYSGELDAGSTVNPGVFHYETVHEEGQVGEDVISISTNELLIGMTPEDFPNGATGGPGRASAIIPSGLVDDDNELPVFRFACRLSNPFLRSIDITGGGTGAILHWSEALTSNAGPSSDLRLKLTNGTGKKYNAVTAGDGTNDWTVTLQADTNANPPGTASVVAGMGSSAAFNTPNIEYEGPIIE